MASKFEEKLGSIHFKISYDQKIQTLSITVVECRDLKQSRFWRTEYSFVKLYLLPGTQQIETKNIEKNLNPQFNETFNFLLPMSEVTKKTLVFQVWRWDIITVVMTAVMRGTGRYPLEEVQIPLWEINLSADTVLSKNLHTITGTHGKPALLHVAESSTSKTSASSSDSALYPCITNHMQDGPELRFAHHDIQRQLSQSQAFAKRRDPDRSDRPEFNENESVQETGEENVEKISNKMQLAEKECKKLERQLEKAKRMMPPDEMDKSMVISGDYKKKITNIEKLDQELTDAIETLLQEHESELGDSKSKMWEDKIVTVENATKDYIRRVRNRAEEFTPRGEQRDHHPVHSAASGGQHSRRGNQATGGNSGCDQQSTSPEQLPRVDSENDSEDEWEVYNNKMKNKMKALEATEKKHDQDVLQLEEENKIELKTIENEKKTVKKALDNKNAEKCKSFKMNEDKYRKMMMELTEDERVWEDEHSIAIQQMLDDSSLKAENQEKNHNSKKLLLIKAKQETKKAMETLFKKMKKTGIITTPSASEVDDSPMKSPVDLDAGHLSSTQPKPPPPPSTTNKSPPTKSQPPPPQPISPTSQPPSPGPSPQPKETYSADTKGGLLDAIRNAGGVGSLKSTNAEKADKKNKRVEKQKSDSKGGDPLQTIMNKITMRREDISGEKDDDSEDWD